MVELTQRNPPSAVFEKIPAAISRITATAIPASTSLFTPGPAAGGGLAGMGLAGLGGAVSTRTASDDFVVWVVTGAVNTGGGGAAPSVLRDIVISFSRLSQSATATTKRVSTAASLRICSSAVRAAKVSRLSTPSSKSPTTRKNSETRCSAVSLAAGANAGGAEGI